MLRVALFAALAAGFAMPVWAADSSDYIEYQPLTPKAPYSNRLIPKQPDDASQRFTIYGSVEKAGSGVGVTTSTSDGHKWEPVIDVSVGTGF